MMVGLSYDLWVQALIALVAGVSATLLGLRLVGRTWAYAGNRSVRDFLVGLCLVAVGFSWLVTGVGIVTTATSAGSSAVVRDTVVFFNAFVRVLVVVCGAYLLYRSTRGRPW